MKRIAVRRRKSREFPIAWHEVELAAQKENAMDSCDDRVSEDIFDVEDEWAEVDVIAQRMHHHPS